MNQWGRAVLATGVAMAGAVLAPGMAGASSKHGVGGPKLTVIDPAGCYLSSLPPGGSGRIREALVHVEGTGWTPGTKVKVGIGYLLDQVTKTVSSDGSFTAAVQVSALPASAPDASGSVVKTFTSAPVIADTSSGLRVRSANVSYAVRGFETFIQGAFAGANSYEEWNYPLIIDGAGLASGRAVFAHYLQISRGGSRVVATRDLGVATGPCGVLHYRSEVFPSPPSAAERGKTYKLQLGPKTYSAKTTLYSYEFRLYP